MLDCLVDLTGGLSEMNDLQSKENMAVAKVDHTNMWNFLHGYFQQKFFIACINTSLEQKGFKNVDQGQQGILESHYYTIIDMKDFPKDNLKLIRVRNPWGS
jgi:calpain, invertebrate